MFAAFLSTVCGSLLSICVTALSAFSVTIIFRTSTTANFAQGSIAAFGCYVVAECLNRWGVPVYLGVLPGMIVGVVIGLFIDLMVFRKGRHVGELGKQIITMGFVPCSTAAFRWCSAILSSFPLNPFIIPPRPVWSLMWCFVPLAGRSC